MTELCSTLIGGYNLSATKSEEALSQVTQDLRAEGLELYQVLQNMDTGYWSERSSFKDWTVWDVVAHLHIADHMALTSLSSAEAFQTLMDKIRDKGSIRDYAEDWLLEGIEQPLSGPEILEKWWSVFENMCSAFQNADPNQRYVWAGPGMKARMLATARQMETWAHGWEVYDLMNKRRTHSDRLKNIATIGVKTYGWTFNNRGMEPPGPMPKVELESPSGSKWVWNDEVEGEYVSGLAVEFCQVVTQVRNIQDTQLTVMGHNAKQWMAIAQCFAGPPEDPPAVGTRFQI